MRTASILPLLLLPALAAAQTPILDVTPGRLSFITPAGSSHVAQRLVIKNAGEGPLRWRAVPSAPWLRVAPPSGQGPGEVEVSIDSTRLSVGSHAGRVTISSVDMPAVVPVVVSVNVQVVAGQSRSQSTITISRPSAPTAAPVRAAGVAPPSEPRLDLSVPAGSTAPVEAVVVIESPSDGPVEWFAKSDRRWLTAEPSTGMTPARVTVRVVPQSGLPGVQQALLLFVDDAGDAMLGVPVTLTIEEPPNAAPAPVIVPAAPPSPSTRPTKPGVAGVVEVTSERERLSIATDTLSPATRNLPYSQAIPIKGGTPPYFVGVVDGRMPVGLTLANGAITGLTRLPGVYPLVISVTDSSTPPQTVTKALVLRVIIVYRDTALSVSASALTLYGTAGRKGTATRVAVSSGPQSLVWSAAGDQTWLQVLPSEGVAPGAFQVDIDATTLTPGVYSGTITVTMEGAPNSPMRIPVQITIQ
jgi:hypothetical protein